MPRRFETDTKPTVYDVAEQAQVSIATVSRYFSAPEKLASGTRERVGRVVERLGYVQNSAARRLAGGATGTVALCLPDYGDEDPALDLTPSDGSVPVLRRPPDSAEDSDLYYSEILLGAEMESRRNARALTVLIDRDAALEERLSALDGQVDGMVVVAPALADERVEALGHRLPIVLVAARGGEPHVDSVRCDNAAGMHALTGHLIDDHGLRNVEFVAGPDDSPDSHSRFEGFRRALGERGLPVPEAPRWRGHFTRAGGADAGRALLEAGRLPDAVVCANDQMALGVLGVLNEAGIRVPDDVAITGFDDISAARWAHPALTTVRQPMLALGRAAMALLQQRITSPEGDSRLLTLPVQLVLRASCGCG